MAFEVKNALSRIASYLVFRASEDDRQQWRQVPILLFAFVCSVGVLVTFSSWWLGQGPLWKPLLWALPVVLLLTLSPDRRIFAIAVVGMFGGYGVRGLILGQTEGYWVVGISAVLIFLIVITAPSKK
jgi:hypothetical protein